MKYQRVALSVAGAVIASLACVACTSSHASSGSPTSNSGASSTVATTPSSKTTSPVSSPSTTAATSSPASGTAYNAAKAQWIAGAAASSARFGQYWTAAANALQSGGSPSASYLQAITDLTQLAALPAANQTPAEQEMSKQLTQDLDTFFNTAGLYN